MSEQLEAEVVRLRAIIAEAEEISQGIYPQAVRVGSPTDYEERTERMNGWNEAVMDHGQKFREILARHSEGYDADKAFLVSSGAVFLNDNGTLCINLNDTWAWACADGEDVPPDKIKEVASLYRSWGHAGLLYWSAKQRGFPRSEFVDINRFIAFVRREEDWKTAEPSSTKRAYKDIPAHGEQG